MISKIKRRAFIKNVMVGGFGLSWLPAVKNILTLDKSDKPLQFLKGLSTDYVHFNSYGQSLSIGGLGGLKSTVISKIQRFDSVMPNLGVRSRDYELQAPNSFSLLVEKLSPDGTEGETLCSGACEMFIQAIEEENNIPFNKKQFQLHGVASGEGGQSVKELSKDSMFYQRLIKDIENAYLIAKKKGKTFAVGCIGWTQGERDYYDNTDFDQYKSLLTQLHTNVNADVMAITRQTNRLPFIVGQTSSQNTDYDSMIDPIIALAQLELCMQHPGFIFAAPMYMLDFISVDNIHLNNLSYRILAAYYGYAAKKILVDKRENFIYPKNARVIGNGIHLKFNVPIAPLKFDTTRVINPGNYGFIVKNVVGDDVIIKKIKFVAPDIVLIKCAASPAGGQVWYAINGGYKRYGRTEGSRGCLRDSQGDTVVFDPKGTNWPLHNWTPIFKLNLTSGNPTSQMYV